MRRRATGLTLLELLLVLVILTVVATIAVESIEPKVDQSRFEATQQTINNVDSAIVSRQKNTNGSYSYTGFVADMGRLPQARTDVSGTVLTLSELWLNPGVENFAVRKADNAEGGVPVGREDAEVLVATGWNGPYFQLPVGATVLSDGWGIRLATELPSGTSYSHLRSRDASGNEIDVTRAGDFIYGVRSLGRNNILDPADTNYDRDVPLTLQITDNRISGVVQGDITVGGNAPSTEKIIVQLYGADGTTGLVRVDRVPDAGFSNPNSVGLSSYTFNDGNANHNVKVGVHAIRAYQDNGSTADEIDGNDDRSQIVYFEVRPGINALPDLDIVPYP